jgi:hypothetical protein
MKKILFIFLLAYSPIALGECWLSLFTAAIKTNTELAALVKADKKVVDAWRLLFEQGEKETLKNLDELKNVAGHLDEINEAGSYQQWKLFSSTRRKLTVKDISQLGSAGGTIKITLADEAGNVVGELKRVPGTENIFNYYFTDFNGLTGIIKNQQYSLQSVAKLINSASPGNFKIPSGETILYMDFNLPKNVRDNYSGLGKLMFDDAYTYHASNGKVDGIYGEWIKNADLYPDDGGVSVNLQIFWQEATGGLSHAQAALKSITGQWALTKGFSKVDFVIEPSAERVEVIFRK